jgi:ATP-dependent DNA ligase
MLSSKFTGKEAEKQGLEGIMAKRADSLYLMRSMAWCAGGRAI